MPEPTHLRLPLLFILLATFLTGQAQKNIEKEALQAYEQRNYSNALSLGESLLSLDSQRIDALFICGESAMYLGSYELAETYLRQIPDNAKRGLYAVTDLRIATVKLKQGKCNDARYFFEKYTTTFARRGDLFLRQFEDELLDCGMTVSKDQPVAAMDIQRLGPNVNTARSETSPMRYADKLYFTSSSPIGKNGKYTGRIYTAVRDEPAQPFQGNPKENNVHAAHTALTPDASRVYYSLCDRESTESVSNCNIWYRERTYEGGWGPVKKMPAHINKPGFNTYQPAIGFDKNLKKEVLFFVSDRDGGGGKLDIWYCTLERDGSFGEPVNLPFNTAFDDVTPYFDNSTQTLFFSSSTPAGSGGFDIYRSEKAATGEWTTPQNLGLPINSAFDDLYFTFHTGSHLAYFASDRPSENCADPATSCRNFDIYKARILASLDVSIYDAADSTNLYGTTVELMDLITGNIESTYLKINGNKVNIPLDLGRSYRLIVSRLGFFPFFADINTSRINHPASLEEQVYLKAMNPKADNINMDYGTGGGSDPDK